MDTATCTTRTARCTCCGMRRQMSGLQAADGTSLGLCHDCAHEHIAGIRFCPVQAMRPRGEVTLGSEWDMPEQSPEEEALARLTAAAGHAPLVLNVVQTVA